MKNEKGVTLISLVVTIVVLGILAGIGLRSLQGEKSNINMTKSQVFSFELKEVQQMVLEDYFKYQQTQGQSNLIGDKISLGKAQGYLEQINSKADEEYKISKLAVNNDDTPEKCYYELNKGHLKKMGFDNVDLESLGLNENDDKTAIYVVNYSSGEVFNIVVKVTFENKPLYIKVTD